MKNDKVYKKKYFGITIEFERLISFESEDGETRNEPTVLSSHISKGPIHFLCDIV